jgi:hypothetical protein
MRFFEGRRHLEAQVDDPVQSAVREEFAKFCPSKYSMAMKWMPSCSPMSWSCAMLG